MRHQKERIVEFVTVGVVGEQMGVVTQKFERIRRGKLVGVADEHTWELGCALVEYSHFGDDLIVQVVGYGGENEVGTCGGRGGNAGEPHETHGGVGSSYGVRQTVAR